MEVERLPSPNPSSHHDEARGIYILNRTNTSRQNLDTIVEAIRHLEGDHMFGDEPQTQEVPLALTTTRAADAASVLKADMQAYIDFSNATTTTIATAAATAAVTTAEQRQQQQQQSRPGVIVVKQASWSNIIRFASNCSNSTPVK